MATTIQVNNDTVAHLKHMRDGFGFFSYNDLLQYLIRRETARKSFWGAGQKKVKMKKILEDLRDESCRF